MMGEIKQLSKEDAKKFDTLMKGFIKKYKHDLKDISWSMNTADVLIENIMINFLSIPEAASLIELVIKPNLVRRLIKTSPPPDPERTRYIG